MRSSAKTTMGILTGDPAAPGLTFCIQQLVARADQIGMQVCWIQDGWDALLAYSPNDIDAGGTPFISLNPARARKLHHLRGPRFCRSCTIGHANDAQRQHGRVTPKRTGAKGQKAITERVKGILDRLGIEVLVTIGGDEILSLALQMDQAGVPVVAIPKPWSAA